MQSNKQKLEEIMPLRISKNLKEKLEQLAIKKERTLSGQIRAILKDYVERIEI